ncbi:MAG: DNA translocase FtsK 4TM domain-containing protein, partial [Bacteroidota bacterium]|nr:DNA translocase FtsK 4TM domain-containing protein [Bacteroidota bacterium]
MSKSPQNTKRHTDKEAPGFIRFLLRKETHIASGILLTGVSIYLSIILISFLFTGSSDFSKVNNLPFSKLSEAGNDFRNIGAAIGAWLSNIIVNRWFGIPSLFLVAYLWFVSLRLLGIGKVSLAKVFFLSALGMVWFSLALGLFFKPVYEDTFLLWGGAMGYNLSEWLNQRIGWPGTVLVLVASLLIFLVFAKLTKTPFFKKLSETAPSGGYASTINAKGAVPDEFEESWTGASAAEKKTSGFKKPEPVVAKAPVDVEEEPPVAEPARTVIPQPAPVPVKEDIPFEVKVGGEDNPEEEAEESFADELNKLKKAENVDGYDASYLGTYDPKLDLSHYKYPDARLLKQYENPDTIVNNEEQSSNKRRIQEVLEQFSIR